MKRPAVLQRQGGRRIKKVPKGERHPDRRHRRRQHQGALAQIHEGERTHDLARGRAPDREGTRLRRRGRHSDAGTGSPHPDDLEEIQRRNVEAELARLGYPMQRRIIDGKVWKTWAEPGFPGTQAGGDAEPEDQQ